MKKSIKKVIDRLEIDPGARHLIQKMWKHGYKTKFCCEGHRRPTSLGFKTGAYVTYETGSGDGWFEKNSDKYGLRKKETFQFPPIGPGTPHEIYRGRYIRNPEKKQISLENRTSAIIALIGMGGGSLFLSSNLTGNVIRLEPSSNTIGATLILIGLLGGIFLIRGLKNRIPTT